jgi:hypothetical protein
LTRPYSSLEASFEELSAALPAAVGIAIAQAAEVYSFGPWSSGVAWSTIKVPVAIAALRRDRSRAKDLAVRAITESDNSASERLWSQLGQPMDAARQVQSIIEEAGDTSTTVESRRVRPGFTAFGQTHWPLARQAQFAAQLPAIAEASAVLDLMQHLTASHRWGLAAKGIAAKGGWGPGRTGRDYLVRQFGVAYTESGNVGVALAADAPTFDTGVDVLDTLADWLVGHLAQLAARGSRLRPSNQYSTETPNELPG